MVMLECEMIDVCKGIDVNKTSGLLECIICRHWYFLEINVRLKLEVCNSFHNLMQKARSFNDVAIVFVKGNDCRVHFWYTSKNKSISLFKKMLI